MAYVDGKWLDRPERAKRMQLLAERIKKLYALHQMGKATDYHIDLLRKDKAELEKLKRVHRAEVDNAYFCFEYLSDERNPENEDNIIRHAEDGTPHQSLEDLAPIHREFFDLCDYVDQHPGTNLAIAAPRGHSKSGIFSNAWTLKKVVFRQDPYILIISETDKLSKKLIDWCNKQLKFNQKLREDFGELLHPSNTKNEKDNEEGFITSTGTLVEASSSGKQLRGNRHGALRPSTIIVDDPSSENNENTKEAREKLITWFNKAVMPMGGMFCNIVVVGTMVSGTGLLNHVLSRKDFKHSFHDAILSEADHPELWDQYIELYLHGEEGEADAFYEQHKEALEAGAKTAWEWRWSYRALMELKANIGAKAFNSEYRNRAYSEDEQFFFPEQFAYYYYTISPISGQRVVMFEGDEYRLNDMTIAASWDIALGKNSRSCYNSCVVVGRHEKTGRIFVLHEYTTKEQPHKFMEKVIGIIREYKPHVFAVETINAQHEFFRQLNEELRRRGIYTTKLIDVKSHNNSKDKRIESLEPYCANQTLVFNKKHEKLLDQLAAYPFGDFVDAIDALQLAVEHVARPRRSVQPKPHWL